MIKIGLLINPIAGMGGKVGLKGTDGYHILQLAKERGASPDSLNKTIKALTKLLPVKKDIHFFVAHGEMGERALSGFDFSYDVVYQTKEETNPHDTNQLLQQFLNKEVDLILFAGGDGTARDVASVIELRIPVIGIPAGVKIHSPVYAITPEDAGALAREFVESPSMLVIEKEVIDIEEEAFRADTIKTSIYGYLNVPNSGKHLQYLKSPSPQSEKVAQTSAALQVIDQMEEDVYYIIGSGTTTSRILSEMTLPATQLGIDILKNGELVAKDVYEQQILDIIQDEPTKLIVTPMGGQGFLFGRGNQQLSDKVLRKIGKEHTIIVSTHGKINSLFGRPLLIYTGDTETDSLFSGYYKITVGYGQYVIYKAQAADA